MEELMKALLTIGIILGLYAIITSIMSIFKQEIEDWLK